MVTKRHDRIGLIVLLVFALLTGVAAAKLPFGTIRSPGPGFFPTLLSVVLGILCLGAYAAAQGNVSARGEEEKLFAGRQRHVVGVVAAILLYAVVVDPVGFLISTCVLTAFLLGVIERQSWPVVAIGSVVSSLALYLVFGVWLHAQLPAGVISF